MYEDQTPEAVKLRILDRIDGVMDTQEGSQTNDEVSAIAYEICEAYHALDAMIGKFYLDAGSGPWIDRQSAVVGIFRRQGTCAKGLIWIDHGVGFLGLPPGTRVYTADGVALVVTLSRAEDVGLFSAMVEAAEPGSSGNVAAGVELSMMYTLPGIRRIYTKAPVSGGTDAESDGELLARYQSHLRRPPTSGNLFHYEKWALEVSSVGACRVLGKADGPGTVRLVLADRGMAPVSSAVVSDCTTHVSAEMPIGVALSVVAARSAPVRLDATLRLTPDVDAEVVGALIKTAVGAYLQQLARDAFHNHLDCQYQPLSSNRYAVSYHRISYLVLDTQGVQDYTTLTLNGGTSDVEITADAVPVISTHFVADGGASV